MFEAIIRYSVKHKIIVAALMLVLIAAGIFSLSGIPIDAVPDITNNQVQVVTVSNTLAPQEVEQFITYPVEVAMANLPGVSEIRSISRFGLSVVTVVFHDRTPLLDARQLVKEQIDVATAEIPEGLGTPELMPITTGLGEIYQYVLQLKPGYEDLYDPMELRTIQDWIVKRQLAGTPGIIEISSFGGYLKQYEVAVDPLLLRSADLTLAEVFDALSRNNQNSGGSYIEKSHQAFYIRTEGMVRTKEEVGEIVVKKRQGNSIRVRDIAKIRFGSAKRFGAMTMDGKGEVAGGITLMLKGANSSTAIRNVHQRIEEVRKSLPEGVDILPYLDRSVLVGKTTSTVAKNLIEGGLIVIFVLVLLLGNLRAGFIVASVIPLSMLFALILMNVFGVSANLMSLGAIDFGIVVDGAVIIVESVLHFLYTYRVGKHLSREEMDEDIIQTSSAIYKSAAFGVLIILVVFIPIMTLTGIEGKMFRPMAMTVSFAVLGALLLSLTYVPMMASLLLKRTISEHHTFADRLVQWLRDAYRPVLNFALDFPKTVISLSLGALVGSILLFNVLGAEFIPTLEEGDLAMQMSIQPGSSLDESVRTTTEAERILLENFPEVNHVVSKIGTAEVPTDPMAIEDADIMIILKDKTEWTTTNDREELVGLMKLKLEAIIGATFEFTQPIQLRFNELMTGAKTDIVVKIFGENVSTLKKLADQAAVRIEKIPGAGDVKVEQTEGLQQMLIRYDRKKIAEYGANIEELNRVVRMAYAGEKAGVVFEDEKRFDLVVRFDAPGRQELDLDRLFIHLQEGHPVPLSEFANVEISEGPMQISREEAKRKINIGINVRNRDLASLVDDIKTDLETNLNLPPGYSLRFGGQFENLEAARKRLSLAVPLSLLMIFFLLYLTFRSARYALLIFSAIPLSAIGGVIALAVRGMPFSISAGVGFIALFGVAVLNGIVLLGYFNRLQSESYPNLKALILDGAMVRLRPVVMTAAVASLGFLPMALSTTNGAEVQRPLATVVIGGLITSTMLTLLILPALYLLTENKKFRMRAAKAVSVLLLLGLGIPIQAQNTFSMQEAEQSMFDNHPEIQNAALQVRAAEVRTGEWFALPPTDIQYQGGQINFTGIDHYVEISQDFGSIFSFGKKRDWLEAGIPVAESNAQLISHRLLNQLRLAYDHWLWSAARLKLLQKIESLQKEALERTKLRYAQGDIDRLDYDLLETEHLFLQNDLSLGRQILLNAESELRKLAFLPENRPLIPDSVYAKIGIQIPDSMLPGESLFAPFEAIQAESRMGIRHLQGQKLPGINAGFFYQTLDRQAGFKGWRAGISIPVWNKPANARIEQERIRMEIITNDDVRERHSAAMEVDKIIRELKEIEGLLARIEPEIFSRLRHTATLKLHGGDTDYFRFVQALSASREAELRYLELIHRYNQAAIRLEYYR